MERYANQIVIGSEAALALYPLLIKKVPTNLETQLLSRFATFVGLAFLGTTSGTLKSLFSTTQAAKRTVSLGTITLAHVASSYKAFETLPAGTAMSLFYTYPILNVLVGVIGFGESVKPFQLLLIAAAFVGVVLVSLGTKEAGHEGEEKQIHWGGVLAALAAAATETLMYFGVRTSAGANPYFATLELYLVAFLGMAAYSFASPILSSSKAEPFEAIDKSPGVWLKLLGFNAVIGFIGYLLRFYAIPKVATATFSLLSFIGVVASFFWGWLFADERPNALTIAGATLITAAATLV
jgi:drug/metabolite transporter (DMT)-like permease